MQVKVENDEYAEFLARALRAYARRVGDGDIEALPLLVGVRDQVDAAINDAVAELRSSHWNYSWGDIARVLNIGLRPAEEVRNRLGGVRMLRGYLRSITRQSAWERWQHVDGLHGSGMLSDRQR